MATTLSYPANACSRNSYGALTTVPAEIDALVRQVAREAGWGLGAASSGTYGRRSYVFEARNVSVYGYSLAPQLLALVQIRRYEQNKYGGSLRKSYALVGLDGDQLFSHVLPGSPLAWTGLRNMSPEDAIQKAESKIFRVPIAKLGSIIRQGDIAIVPAASIPGSAVQIEPEIALHRFVLANSHDLTIDGDLFEAPNSDLYVRGLVEIDHARGQHHPVDFEGRARIVIGSEGREPWWMRVSLAD